MKPGATPSAALSQRTRLEDALAYGIKLAGLPAPEREWRFHPTRRWRFDFAYPEQRVAIEVEGGIFVQGRHARGTGILGDLEKYNAATLLGWRVLRFAAQHIRSGEAVAVIREALGYLTAK